VRAGGARDQVAPVAFVSIEPDRPVGSGIVQPDALVRFVPVSHRPWSTVLLVGHVLVAALSIAIVGLAIVVVVADNADHADKWDGLAAGIAMMVGGVMLVLGAAAVVFVVLARKGRRRADDGDPRTREVVASTDRVLGALVACVTVLVVFGGGSWKSKVALVLLTVTGLWALAGHLTLRRMKSPYVVRSADSR